MTVQAPTGGPDVLARRAGDRGPEVVAASSADRAAHLRVAPKASRSMVWRRRRARYAVFGVAAISAASMFVLVAFHVFAVQSAFQLDKLRTQLAAEQRSYEINRSKVAALSSPEAVARAARALDMVRPVQVIMLHPPSATPLRAVDSLPVPPPTPYNQIAAGP